MREIITTFLLGSFILLSAQTVAAQQGTGAQVQQTSAPAPQNHTPAPQDSPPKTSSADSGTSQPEPLLPVQGKPQASQFVDRYPIEPGDVLDIRVFNRPQLSREAVRVENNGMIRMPLIDGEIQAACKTEGELAKEIADSYVKYYRKPDVGVFIKEHSRKDVAILGAVNEQGRFQLQRRIRLLELLTYAKGPSEKHGQVINILHEPKSETCRLNSTTSNDTASLFVSYKLKDTLRAEEAANPYVQPGDIITIPEADLVYVVGNVYNPRELPLKGPTTVSHAITLAGGVRPDSKKDRVRIVRQQPGSATTTEILVNLNAIARSQAEDVALQPNDVIEVPTSKSFGRSLVRGLQGLIVPTVAQLPVRVIW